MKYIAVLTCGGDAPGMNLAIAPLDEVVSKKKPLDFGLIEWSGVITR